MLVCRMWKYAVFKYKISIIINYVLKFYVRDDCELNPTFIRNMKWELVLFA